MYRTYSHGILPQYRYTQGGTVCDANKHSNLLLFLLHNFNVLLSHVPKQIECVHIKKTFEVVDNFVAVQSVRKAFLSSLITG